MRLRTGRRNTRNLYLQLGDRPSNSDPCVGFMVDDDTAAIVVDGLTSPWHLNEIKLSVEARDQTGPFAPPEKEPPREP